MKKKKLQIVIDNLKIVKEKYIDTPLNMWQGFICENEDEICGTPHCFAGWYFIAKNGAANEREGYRKGIELMTEDLGFSNVCDLKSWAHKNQNIWGNKYGGCMFANRIAFSSETRPDGAKSLQDIIDHLTEVKSRL